MSYKNKQMQDEYQREYQREYQEWYRRNYDWIRYYKIDAQLGTTSFSEYMERDENGKPDFEKEHKEIQKEKRRTMYGKYKQYGGRKKHFKHRFLSNFMGKLLILWVFSLY